MVHIRNACWETNSSSNHVIVTTDDTRPYDLEEEFGYHIHDHAIHIYDYDLDFGRGFKVLASPFKKMCYAIASLAGGETRPRQKPTDKVWAAFQEIQRIVCQRIPDAVLIELPTRLVPIAYDENDIIYDRYSCVKDPESPTGISYVNPETGEHIAVKYGIETVTDFGYVDHQSMGFLEEFMQRHEITVEDFIFDRRYVAFEDSDELCYLSDMQEAGLLSSHIKAMDTACGYSMDAYIERRDELEALYDHYRPICAILDTTDDRSLRDIVDAHRNPDGGLTWPLTSTEPFGWESFDPRGMSLAGLRDKLGYLASYARSGKFGADECAVAFLDALGPIFRIDAEDLKTCHVGPMEAVSDQDRPTNLFREQGTLLRWLFGKGILEIASEETDEESYYPYPYASNHPGMKCIRIGEILIPKKEETESNA